MAWTETRSGTTTAARGVAHDDRAKDRRDEAKASAGPRVRPRWLWPVVAGVVLVLVGGSAAVALVASRDDPPPERAAGPAASPSPGDTGAPASPVTGEPLSGDLTAVGRVTSTSSLGTRWQFPMTIRLKCTESCSVTVVEAPGSYQVAARAYAQRVFTPAGDGVYKVVLNEPLTRSGGQVTPGCEALHVRGTGTAGSPRRLRHPDHGARE